MSNQLTRDARKSFRRCAVIKLVCIASPTSKSLNEVVRNMRRELLPWLPQWGSCGWKNCLQSLRWRKFAAANQSGLSETKVDHLQVGTRGQVQGEVSQQSMNCTEGCPSQTNMDVATLTDWIRF